MGDLIIQGELIEISRQLLLGILGELCQGLAGQVPAFNGILGSLEAGSGRSDVEITVDLGNGFERSIDLCKVFEKGNVVKESLQMSCLRS